MNELQEAGQACAVNYLEGIKGYEIIATNVKCSNGVIDIVALDHENNAIVLAEVKTKKSGGFSNEGLTPNKRAKWELMAAQYLATADKEMVGMGVRFDTVYILALGSGLAMVRHHVNASAGME